VRIVEETIKMVREKYADYSVEDICNEEKICLYRCETGAKFFGFYVNLLGSVVIGLRDNLTPQETREVIAHELFHHFDHPVHSLIGKKDAPLSFVNFYMKRDELRADMFAAKIICPDISDCGTVADIMQKYDCSKGLAKLRRKVEEQLKVKKGG